MHIHRVQGSSLKDALLRARRAHGADAIVIQHEVMAGGDVALALVKPATAAAREPAPRAGHRAVARDPEARDPGAGDTDSPTPTKSAGKPAIHELATRLRRHGASRSFADAICARVDERLEVGVHAMDVAADVIGEAFPAVRCPKLPGVTRVLVLVGAPGSGKTQTLVKLAWKMRAAGRRVELAMLDDQRPFAYQQLAMWAEHVKAPLSVLDESVRLRSGTMSDVDCVLVDSTGDAKVDVPRLVALQRSLESDGVKWETEVVLSATEKTSHHDLALASFAPLQPAGLVLTKLDRAQDPASALEYARSREMPVTFLCNGESLVDSLHRADPARVADLFLCGRIA